MRRSNCCWNAVAVIVAVIDDAVDAVVDDDDDTGFEVDVCTVGTDECDSVLVSDP